MEDDVQRRIREKNIEEGYLMMTSQRVGAGRPSMVRAKKKKSKKKSKK